MEKIKVTQKDKEEFKKTAYGKKCYNRLTLIVILLFVSCMVTGFLTGYSESGKELFKHQNMVLLIMIIVAIICAEQIGKCEGALNEFVLSKKKDDKEDRVVKTVSKEVNKIVETKDKTKKNYVRKNANNKQKQNTRAKNEK